MNGIRIVLLTALCGGVHAITFAQSMPETAPDPVGSPQPRRLLDTNDILGTLEPLPDLGIPDSLPGEFTMTPKEITARQKLSEANRLMREGNPAEAREIFRAHLEAQPDAVNVRVALADSLFAADDHKGAQREYRRVLERAPMQFQALNNLAWMQATVRDPDIHDPETALELARKARVVFVNSHHVWSTLSHAYYENGRFKEAAEAAEIAIRLAQRQQVPIRVSVNYLIQLDRCRAAVSATSILE